MYDCTISVNFRENVASSLPVAFLTYSCPIVEPPPVPPVSRLYTVRRIALMSKPEFVMNVSSSAAICAFFMVCGIWSHVTTACASALDLV